MEDRTAGDERPLHLNGSAWRSVAVTQVSLGLASLALVALGPLLVLSGTGVILVGLAGVLVFLPMALACWQLARTEPRARSSFQAVRGSMGEGPGFFVGWLLLSGTLLVAALSAVAGGEYLSSALTNLAGVAVSWQTIALASLALASAALFLEGTRWTQIRGWVWGVLSLGLLVCALFMFFHPQSVRFRELSGISFKSLTAALPFLSLSLLGCEIALNRRGPDTKVLALPFYVLACSGGLSLAILAAGALGLANAQMLASEPAPLAQAAYQAWGLAGQGIVSSLAVVALLLAQVALLRSACQQARELSAEGYLPRLLAATAPLPKGRPGALLVLLNAVAAGLLALFLSSSLSLSLAAFALLAGAGLVSWAAAAQPRTQPEDGHLLPFHPLLPAIGAALAFFLLWTLPRSSLFLGAAWIGVGLLSYLGYARRSHTAAMEGVTIFRGPKPRKVPADLRILVPLAPGEERRTILPLALAIARQWQGEVLPLRVLTPDEEAEVDEETSRKVARERSVLFGWAVDNEKEAGIPIQPITRVSPNVAEGILQTASEERCQLIVMGWEAVDPDASAAGHSHVVDAIVHNAPCDVVVVEGEGPGPFRRILVPTAGGPHAPLAAQLGAILAADQDGQVTALYVCREDATPAEKDLARSRIASTVARLPHRDRIRPKVLCSDAGVLEAILTEATESHDIIIVGASEENPLDRQLLGDLPEQLARRYYQPVVIVKRYPGRWAQRLGRAWDRLYGLFPSLHGAEQLEVYRALRRGARPNVNYFVLITLSGIIATLGLTQNSPAVIIGAMLVAPLMTPILAISLGIVLGEVSILRVASESTLKGVAAAIGIAAFLSLLVPEAMPSAAILARAQPSILDLVIALASGAAAAYAVARKEVAAALPGVAIAAALMPPLCTVGIGLASGWGSVAGGALLLFVTNLVAISLAGGAVFLLLGFRPRRRERHSRIWFRRGVTISFVLLLVVTGILGGLLVRSLRDARQETAIRQDLTRELSQWEGVRLVELEWETGGQSIVVNARVQSPEGLNKANVESIAAALSKELGRPVTLRIVVEPVLQVTSP